MNATIPPRRKAFDDIADGWGSDSLEDLAARMELLADFWTNNFPLSTAEVKVARAMSKRLHELGGIEFTVPQ